MIGFQRAPTQGNTNNHHDHHKASPGGRRVSSPGYHSAASSPGSSISSPVSSSASTTSSASACSYSSGISAASSTSASSNNSNNNNNNNQQQPVRSSPTTPTTTAHSQLPTTTTTSPKTIVSCTTANLPHSPQTPAGGTQTQQQHTAMIPSVSPTLSSASHHYHKQQQQQQSSPAVSQQAANNNNNNNHCNLPNLLDYYPETQQDGLNLSWFHGTNNRQSLNSALVSSKLIVSGDISLAEMSRYPVPIMARPPLGVSDLTLENWLSDVIAARKGIKLTFTSTRTVEPAFRVLARHAEHLKGPLILSADILTRPVSGGHNAQRGYHAKQQQQQRQPVDAWTFLMLCRTRFPKSIISIGWCSEAGGGDHKQPIAVSDSVIQHADSITTSADSMFELDMMMDYHQHQQQHPQQPHHFNQPILHLSPAPPLNTSQHHRSSLSSLSVVQQLAAVAAAAAVTNNNNKQHPQQQQSNHHRHHRLSVSGGPNGPAHCHHYILSSNGSLNSSSGNSSGSPSPTSPISHLMSPPHNHNHNHLHHHQPQRHLHHDHQHGPTSTEQLILAAANQNGTKSALSSEVVGWPAVAAAAMVAASTLQQRQEVDDEEEDDDDNGDQDGHQLPLNLNINEADPQHATATLSDLAQKIQSLQQQSSNLNSITSSLCGGGGGGGGQTQQSSETAAAFELASKLFNGGNVAALTNMSANHNNHQWEHISKKAALANRLNSNSPSPVSTSPKNYHNHNHNHNNHLHQHQQQSNSHNQGNLLCVRTSTSTSSLANLAAASQSPAGNIRQQQQQQQQASMSSSSSSNNNNNNNKSAVGGYTREMIDKMASLVKEYNLTQAITFPVEARLLQRSASSLSELQRLLCQTGANSTLTIVAQQEDLISVEELLVIRRHFGANQILFDLPDELATSLRQELGTEVRNESNIS